MVCDIRGLSRAPPPSLLSCGMGQVKWTSSPLGLLLPPSSVQLRLYIRMLPPWPAMGMANEGPGMPCGRRLPEGLLWLCTQDAARLCLKVGLGSPGNV